MLFRSKEAPWGEPNKKIVVEKSDTLVFKPDGGKSGIRASLGPPSNEMAVFMLYSPWIFDTPLTLQIDGAEVNTNGEALGLLESFANSLFFGIDLASRLPLRLDHARQLPLPRKRGPSIPIRKLPFPTAQYNPRAMSLYWYGRFSGGMPLLQFLAFYQVTEFFFPLFSEQDAICRIKLLLKDPRFDVHSDDDVGKIVRTLKPSGRGFGSELSKMQATISSCIDPKQLRGFLTEDEGMKRFYESNFKSIAKQAIPIKNPVSDLLNETAQRLYEIRCRIVHTKDTSEELESEPLLPFSREADQLQFDIALMEFVATKVVIAASERL